MELVSRHPFEWDHYDTVLLDMDGTLLDLRFDNFFWQELIPARYAALHNLPHEEAVAVLEPRFAAARGTLEWYCLDHWSRELGLDVAALKREAEDHIDFLPDVPDFLLAVRELRKRVVLVTNAHRGSLSIKLERTGLARYLDAIHSSHDLGVPKEHAEFWGRLRAIEPFDAPRTMLVDDSLPVLRSAHDFGIGRVIAILRPDSSRPAVAAADFHGVESVTELLPRGPRRGGG
ncbi:MAG TPA: GMP/IMP nucleotidase [Gammaproteobacteria bacterium]|nr:GMP/IMP nucleotidase [Gammaproteobacteria bacterium]HRP87022.1 GMP/IMP nucleotidase [Gammaproteobacteria bacterium]